MTDEMYDEINDHVEIALGRQVYQYKEGVNWNKLIQSHVDRYQIQENVQFQLLTERDLTNAVGVQLELLGADYKLTRDGSESDEDFRARIRVEISLLRGNGQVPVLIFSLQRLVEPRAISLNQIFPLKILMWIFVDDFNEITQDEIDRINLTMEDVKAAGVGLDVGLQLNNNVFKVAPTALGGAAGEGVATLIDGSDGGAFVKSI